MLFGVQGELQTDIIFNNVTIKNSKKEKTLGIFIDSKLHFSKNRVNINNFFYKASV